MPWVCTRCSGRTRWCHWCKVRHCACRPHVSRAGKYRYKVHTIRREDGTHRFMSARRYAHLKGAQRGGQTTALRPNPGRFNSETARKAALARWLGRHKANPRTGLRPGRVLRRTRPEVSRAHLRYLYSRVPRLGIRFDARFGVWHAGCELRRVANGDLVFMWGERISERTALRRLGHLPAARKNWVPGEFDQIVATTTGTDPATRKGRRTKA
jgi:hypothetical protein